MCQSITNQLFFSPSVFTSQERNFNKWFLVCRLPHNSIQVGLGLWHSMYYLQEKGHLLEIEHDHILYSSNYIRHRVHNFLNWSWYCIKAQCINHFHPFWQLYFKSTDVYNERWRNAWIIPAFWQVLSFSLLCIICVLWAPSQNSMRYYPTSTLLCMYMHFTEFSPL